MFETRNFTVLKKLEFICFYVGIPLATNVASEEFVLLYTADLARQNKSEIIFCVIFFQVLHEPHAQGRQRLCHMSDSPRLQGNVL